MATRLTYALPYRELPAELQRTGGRRPATTSTRARNPLAAVLLQVAYDPGPPTLTAAQWGRYDPNWPARDLIQHAMMFRAVHGISPGRNVAVAEVTLRSGECIIVAAMSGGHMHSEQRMAAILQGLDRGTGVAQVTRMFTDLEPCDDGPGCRNCRTTVAELDPRLRPQTVFYSFEYDSGVYQRVVDPDGGSGFRDVGLVRQDEDLARSNRELAARTDEFRARAATHLAQGVVIDGLCNLSRLPGLQGMETGAGTMDDARVVMSVRDAADLQPVPPGQESTLVQTIRASQR